jgi:hypothetical protein
LHDVFSAFIALLADRFCCVEARRCGMALRKSTQVSYRSQSLLASAFRVELLDIGERDERGHGLTGALDDQPLPGGGLVNKLAEVLSHLDRGYGSHSTIITA